ncbi:MAG: hypothetical protein WA191_02710, partial [Telluria sp.]
MMPFPLMRCPAYRFTWKGKPDLFAAEHTLFIYVNVCPLQHRVVSERTKEGRAAKKIGRIATGKIGVCPR